MSRESIPSGALPGVAYLVGAGPGDPGLMTARALELIATADAILYDRLLPARALDDARDDADLIYVGKRPGEVAMPQAEIEHTMVRIAGEEGRSVVRLKGGDPLVFGRGAEEAETLVGAGVRFEIVPGVTAGIAAPAYAGIPVTHRDDASGVAFVTGHENPSKEQSAIDWPALASFPGTLVLYMGVGNLLRISERLREAGRPAEQPAAAIQRGTHPDQRTVVATLETLPEAVEREGIGAPAILLFGEVARHRERIGWLERRPLHGIRVVVTRARAQASALRARLEALGAEVVELPAIRVDPRLDSPELEAALDRIRDYSLVCLSSPNAVRYLFEALPGAGLDARSLSAAMVTAIGPGTARALRERSIVPDLVPERSIAESLVEALAEVPLEGHRVLIARAAEARDVLPDSLAERGAEVDVVGLYETVREPAEPSELDVAREADYVTFTSSSTARYLHEAMGESFPPGVRLASIGPATSATIRVLGGEVAIEAERHDPEGLVAALMADVERERRSG